MKKILILILSISLILGTLVSCSENAEYKDVTYEKDGIKFTLPNTMKQKTMEGYDFYFTNQLASLIFTAVKIDKEMLEKADLSEGITAAEYVDAIIEKNGMEKDKMYYKYNEYHDQYNFRYTFVDQSGFEIFEYVIVTGTPDNLWYIEMCCEQEDSATYLEDFEIWSKSIKTTK